MKGASCLFIEPDPCYLLFFDNVVHTQFANNLKPVVDIH